MGVEIEVRPDWVWGDRDLVEPTVYRRTKPRLWLRAVRKLKS